MRRTLIGLFVGVVIGIAVVGMTGVSRAAEGGTESENPLTAWIPDFKVILNDAIGDVFVSAGVEISDPETAEFYGKLTGNVMTNIDETEAAGQLGVGTDFPLIRIASPEYSSSVDGLVDVQIDAIDDADPIGSLAVELLIDGSNSVLASYSPESGYYEASWDSSGVQAGTMHTILATATDSVGTSQSKLTVVIAK